MNPMSYPSPPPPAADTAATEITPRKRWYWIGGGAMVLAALAAIVLFVLLFLRMDDTIDKFARVEGNTTAELRFDRTGKFVIYDEGGGSARLSIISADGNELNTQGYFGDLTYSFNDRSGRAARTVEIPSAGEYTVIVEGSADIAIGKSIAPQLLQAVLVPLGVGAVFGLGGLVTIIVTAVRRSKNGQRLSPVGATFPAVPPAQPWGAAPLSPTTPPPTMQAPPSPPVTQSPPPPPPGSWPNP